MKKLFKSRIFLIVICAITFSAIGVIAGEQLLSDDIKYKTITVEKALDDLYDAIDNNYYNKEYIQDNLTIYDNRVTILNGGYYVDSNNVTWVNITLKTLKSLSNEGAWLLICGFPNINENFYVTDYNKKHAFRVGQNDGKNYSNCITYRGDALITDISTGKEFTLKFKY